MLKANSVAEFKWPTPVTDKLHPADPGPHPDHHNWDGWCNTFRMKDRKTEQPWPVKLQKFRMRPNAKLTIALAHTCHATSPPLT